MKKTILISSLLLLTSGCAGTKYLFPRHPILHCYQDPPPTEVRANKAGHTLIARLRAVHTANFTECQAYNTWAKEQNAKHAKN